MTSAVARSSALLPPVSETSSIGKLRRLRHLVDDAPGRAAAEEGGGGSLVDLEIVDIEHVAVVEAGVAQPVHEVVVARGEAAQVDEIAVRAAFARVERDAGHVLERLGQRGGALLLDHLRRHDVDRLRRVEDLLRQHVERGALGRDHDGLDVLALAGIVARHHRLAERGRNRRRRSQPETRGRKRLPTDIPHCHPV